MLKDPAGTPLNFPFCDKISKFLSNHGQFVDDCRYFVPLKSHKYQNHLGTQSENYLGIFSQYSLKLIFEGMEEDFNFS